MRFVNITCEAKDQSDRPIAGAKYTATLDQLEILDGFVVPSIVHATSNNLGIAILSLWSNSFGMRGSRYRIIGTAPDSGRAFFNELVYVPEHDSFLHDIVSLGPVPPIDLATKALRETSKVFTAIQESKSTVDSAIVDFNILLNTIKENSSSISESKDIVIQNTAQSTLNNNSSYVHSTEATNQAVSAKSSAQEAAAAAATITAGGLPIFFAINNATSFEAVHHFNYLPNVWLLDQYGSSVETDVIYAPGKVTFSFAIPFTGSLYVAPMTSGGISPLLFTINNVVTFTASHYFNYLPDVWLLDRDGNSVETDVAYSSGAVTLSFATSFTGSLYLK